MRPEGSGLRGALDTVVLLDSNIFLEVELAEEHAEACRQFSRRVGDGIIKSAITDYHVDSIIMVMENYDKGWKELALFLASLFHYKGLKVHSIGLGGRIRATSIMRDYGLDFDDALAVQALRDLSTDIIVSYDDFDSVAWVKRRIPEVLL